MKYVVKVLLLFSVLAFVTACSTAGKEASVVDANQIGGSVPGAGETGAMATGIGSEAQFQGVDENAVHRLQAPYNQVYHFAFDSDSLQKNDIKSINVQANYLVAHKSAKVRLEGNTDERGSREYNVALGWRRAKSVARFMEEQGVAPKQLDLVSYGAEKPVAFGHNAAAYAQNRRVNLIYEAK